MPLNCKTNFLYAQKIHGHINASVADPGFPRGGAPTPKMDVKEFGPRGHPWHPRGRSRIPRRRGHQPSHQIQLCLEKLSPMFYNTQIPLLILNFLNSNTPRDIEMQGQDAEASQLVFCMF